MAITISIIGIILLVYIIIKRKQKRLVISFFLIPIILLSISYTIIIKNNSIIWKEINNLTPLQDANFSSKSTEPNIIKEEFLSMFKSWINNAIFPPNIGVKINEINNEKYAEIYSYGFDFDDDNGQYTNFKVIDILVPFKNGDIIIQRWKIGK